MTAPGFIRTAAAMAAAAILAALTVAIASQARAEDKMITTTIRNGNSTATVSQSGDPATTTKRVETRPGYTRIEQKSGNSHSVVIQSDNPADILDKLPPDLRRMLEE
jgi:uncharacterized protein (DUF2147 family)